MLNSTSVCINYTVLVCFVRYRVARLDSGDYWYHGVLRAQRSANPASVRILIDAASASLTVSFTDCIRFCALWTSISVACKGR